MEIIKTVIELNKRLKEEIETNNSIGFVPTMGALHQGHLSLIEKAKEENNIVVCSIFVNPIQFNNPEDFDNYPLTIDSDMQKLENYDCDILFLPSVKEIYPRADNTIYDFGDIEKVMEGEKRPGHFNGVAIVVKRLFEIVKPNKSYFGKKDYQQYLVIKELVKKFDIDTNIIGCDIIREFDGLAMSSRNMRLTDSERKLASIIYQTLIKAKEKFNNTSIEKIKKWVETEISNTPEMEMEYFEIAEAETLKAALQKQNNVKYRCFIAVFLGKVRLIDNIELN